jgi:hypothetical protein
MTPALATFPSLDDGLDDLREGGARGLLMYALSG